MVDNTIQTALVSGFMVLCAWLPTESSASSRQANQIGLAFSQPLAQLGSAKHLQGRYKVKFDNRQAANRAMQHYPGRQILSIQLIESHGPPVHRIKVLSNQGVVKFIFVDAISGEVFE